ncbi:MAG: hypothetical protein LBU80_04510, partial [Rikenellaceae bacterium]|nr:hypothetical protein [Rikenellaceae bacterium]
MMNLFKKLFGRKAAPKTFTDEQWEQDYELKSRGLEVILGPSHPLVGHALIPFAVGGAVDMYYYPNHIAGTGFATMEVMEPDGSGPVPNDLGTYELVAFTRHAIDDERDNESPYNLIEREICGIFTTIANYSRTAKLNPHDTCEVPVSE